MPKVPSPAKKVAPKKPGSSKAKPQAALSTPTMVQVLETLNRTYEGHPMADVTENDPYKVLIGCILSLRTKDEVTIPACERLFGVASTPTDMLSVPLERIERLIYPCGFYRNKAKTIHQVSQDLLDRYEGQTPAEIDELLTLKGVGRKTANLVRGLGHQLPAICVDIHVHRISNRLGYVATQTPDETERALRAKLPQAQWGLINRLLVLHGRECCKPIGARCDVCPVEANCYKVEVKARKQPVASA